MARRSMLAVLAPLSALIWLGLLVLPWQPWRMRERLDADPRQLDVVDLSDIDQAQPRRRVSADVGWSALLGRPHRGSSVPCPQQWQQPAA